MNRVLRVLAIFWIAVITARYLDTTQKSLRNSFNAGDDLLWAKILVAFLAFAGLSLAWNRAHAVKIWLIVMAVVAIVMVILSGSFIPAIIALWVAALATLVGDTVLSKLGAIAHDNLSDRFVIGFPIGIAALGALSFALALTGLYRSSVVWIVLLILTFIQFRHALTLTSPWGEVRVRAQLASKLRNRPANENGLLDSVTGAPLLILLMGFAVLRNFTWAVAPEIEFDTLNMRLAVPRIFLAEGRFVDLPYIWHSYFVHLLEYVHGLGMALHSETVAKLFVAVIGVATALSVYSLGRLVFSARVGLWAAVFFYTTPLVSWGTGTAYNDNAVALFVASSLAAYVYWYRSQQPGWILASGLLAGSAIGVKLNAVYAVIPLSLALAGIVISRKIAWKQRVVTGAGFAFMVCVMALPWYLVVYLLTGNPFFPLMNGVFRSPFWDLNNKLMDAENFGVGTSFSSFLRLPFLMTFETTQFGQGLPRAGLGPLLLIFIPFGFLTLRKNEEARILALVVWIYLVLWAYTFQYGRYYTAVLPGIVILAVGGFLSTSKGFIEQARHSILGALLVAQMALLPLLYWRIPERFPIYLAFGLENKESFLLRTVGGYGAAQYLNRVVKPGEKVLAVGFEEVRFYIKPQLHTYSESRTPGTLSNAMRLPPGPALAKILSEDNFAYLLLTPPDVPKPPEFPYATPEFVKEYATLEYSDKFAQVFHLKH